MIYTFRYSKLYLNTFTWESNKYYEDDSVFECEAENLIEAFLKFKDGVLNSLSKCKEANIYEILKDGVRIWYSDLENLSKEYSFTYGRDWVERASDFRNTEDCKHKAFWTEDYLASKGYFELCSLNSLTIERQIAFCDILENPLEFNEKYIIPRGNVSEDKVMFLAMYPMEDVQLEDGYTKTYKELIKRLNANPVNYVKELSDWKHVYDSEKYVYYDPTRPLVFMDVTKQYADHIDYYHRLTSAFNEIRKGYEWLPWSHQAAKPETLEKAKEVFKKYNLEDEI